MKEAAKFASAIAITGYAIFEPKLDSLNHDFVNFTDASDGNKSLTKKTQIHLNVLFSLIFVDTDGKFIFGQVIVVKMLVYTFSKL